MIKITFPDGSKKEFKKGITGMEIAEGIHKKLAKKAIAVKFNDKVLDMSRPLEESGKLQILTFDDPEGRDVFHHSSTHIMAQAVKRIFPKAQLTIGPTIEGGFYYDIDVPPLKPEDVLKIEKEMKKVVEENHTCFRHEISKKKALELFGKNKYKKELIDEMPAEEQLTYYEQGEFIDLCRGPHIPKTGMVKAFKITKVSSSYWRGDAQNDTLQRLYGVSYPDGKQLQEHLDLIREAEKRDHRKIGKELEWFTFHEYSPGSAFFHHKGAIIFNKLQEFLRTEYINREYQEVITPLLYDKQLWETSGHWEHYKDDMFTIEVDGREFALKPMNCPSHCLMYQNSTKSYRDLPLRITDFAPLHRNELKGVLQGLTRVRKFSQDDAHIFCTMEQIESEIKALLDFVDFIYNKTFGMEYHLELSTRPEKALGSKAVWDKAEKALENALTNNKLDFKINPGDGAFYGPKIDLHVKDCLGRTWQCATIQLDFNLPERFDLTYEGADGKKHRPVMIHRAILGSVERFIGIIVEHFGGKLPLWLSPVQVRILTVSEKFNEYGEETFDKLKKVGIRVELDNRTESIGKKVREAQLEKVNYILVVGEREQADKTVTVRTFHNKVLGAQKVDKFILEIEKEIKNRSL